MSIVHSCEETHTAKRVSGGEPEALDSVVHVRRGGEVAPAADPAEAAGADHLDERGQQCRVALAPHEAGPDDHGLQVGPANYLLCLRLRRRVERGRVRPQRGALVHLHQWLAGHQSSLRAHMDQSPHTPSPAGSHDVSRLLHVDPLEIGGIAEVLYLRGGMKGDLAVLDVEVVEVPDHRLRAATADGGRGALGAGERAHVPALRAEALDESASDEARPACYECLGQRFGSWMPHMSPEHGLFATSATLALPLLSRVTLRLVHAGLFV